MRRLGMAMATMLCLAGTAWADPATFVFSLDGQGVQSDPPYTLSWTGTLTIVTDSGADGTYGYGDLLSFALDSSLGSFVTDGHVDPFLQVGQEVTIAGGKVTSIEGGYSPDHFTKYFFDGLTASYSVSDCTACNLASASGVLTAVPEPGTGALMLAGLGAAGWLGRRRAV